MIALMIMAALIVYLLIAVYVTWKVTKKAKSRAGKLGAAIASVLVFVLIPTWDEIAGRIYFHHLCKTEGGIKVYKTVELGQEYWNPDGSPRFLDANGELHSAMLSASYDLRVMKPKGGNEVGHAIRMQIGVLRDTNTGEELGALVRVSFGGGWIKRMLRNVGGVPGEECPPIGGRRQDSAYLKLIGAVFVKK